MGLTTIYFSSDKNAYPIYPTEKGWFTFTSSTQLSTDIDFKDSHQFTLEFEVFPIDSSFQISVIFESLTNTQKFSISFQNIYTSSLNPYSFTSSVLLKSQKWNKVYITYSRIGTSVRFLVHQLVLQAYGSTIQSVSSYSFDYPYSTYGFTGANIKPVFSGSRMIIKKIKTYLWALESVTVEKDFGIYSYSGDQDLTFSNQIIPNYLAHFSDNNLVIDTTSNAWINYVPLNTNICADLSQKVDETWSAKFELNTYFCIDKWGDGSVITTPQTIQWDDGNNVSGDGWSKDWFIESGYEWEIMPNLGNKSYCHPLWGNSRIDSGEEWDDANYTNGDGCAASCKIEFGFKCTNYSTKASTWFPNWGDKIRDTTPYVEEWDDGNNIDFDGWSKTWKVEFNYQCNNNTGIDICNTIYNEPYISSSKYDSSTSKITVSFSEVMSQLKTTDLDINIFASGPNSPYDIIWTSEFSNKEFVLSFTVTPKIVGGIGEYIQLELINVNGFKSSHNIPMKNPQILKFTCNSLEASSSSQSSGAGASYTFAITIAFSL